MDLLGGEDMSCLRDRVRSTSGTRLIPLPAAAYLATQMLTCIRNIHERGFIHRDIKPANFVRRECNSSEFSIIDFGVAKQFREKNGQLKPKRESAEFRGTVLYASPFAHKQQDQCPRDDLFSLVLVFIDLVCGKLPWADAYRQNKDKAVAAASKTAYLETPDNIIKWVADTVIAAEKVAATEKAMRQSQTVVDMGGPEEGEEPSVITPRNFPASAQILISQILFHLIAMSYEDTPDYDFIEKSFRQMIPEGHPDVANPAYNFNGFQWTGGKDNRMPESIERPADLRIFQKLIIARAKQLGKLVQKAIGQGNQAIQGSQGETSNSQGSSQGSQLKRDLFELSKYWLELATDFLSIDEESTSKETCEMIVNVYREASKFYGVDLTDDMASGSNPEYAMDMVAYGTLQRTNDAVQDRCQQVMRRPKPINTFGVKRPYSEARSTEEI